ncbi:MAG: hypothetical protein NTX87_18895, partial [Planctomycetota bacterium]|nr:hypothetical protein [Planctomycetota bacterium]
MGVHPVHAALTTPYVRTLLKIKSRQLARRPEFRGTDPADISQDLIGQVLKQATRFDASRAGVNTFIAAVVESAAGMMCRDRGRLKRVAGLRLQSLEGSPLQHEGEEKALLDVLVDDDLQRRQGVYGVSAPSRARTPGPGSRPARLGPWWTARSPTHSTGGHRVAGDWIAWTKG